MFFSKLFLIIASSSFCVLSCSKNTSSSFSLLSSEESHYLSINFDANNRIVVEEGEFGNAVENSFSIFASKCIEASNNFVELKDRGIIFNKTAIGEIKTIRTFINPDGFESGVLYYGDNPLSFTNSISLMKENNEISINGAKYFVIQNTGTNPIAINRISIDYIDSIATSRTIPTIEINTKDEETITSKVNYVDCVINTSNSSSDSKDISGKIRLRGNTTVYCDKKPFRIKLNKKQGLFGYKKAKNWVLLADYMDGSGMHNYTALSFAKMIKNDEYFSVTPMHVNVILNGENLGLYLFCEQIDTKENRIDIEQSKIWEKSFSEINYCVERDSATLEDTNEIEGVTYFKVPMKNYPINEYVFAIKYPELEDFIEEKDGEIINNHEEEYLSFVSELKKEMVSYCEAMEEYYDNPGSFLKIQSMIDLKSLALHTVTDQVFKELDHAKKSVRMYKRSGGLLTIGPNWDYDACSYGIPMTGSYIPNPFEVGKLEHNPTYFGDCWGQALFNDLDNGRTLLKEIWNNISEEDLDSFVKSQIFEMENISTSSLFNCEKWMNNDYYALFDNRLYHSEYLSSQLWYLKEYYS